MAFQITSAKLANSLGLSMGSYCVRDTLAANLLGSFENRDRVPPLNGIENVGHDSTQTGNNI